MHSVLGHLFPKDMRHWRKIMGFLVNLAAYRIVVPAGTCGRETQRRLFQHKIRVASFHLDSEFFANPLEPSEKRNEIVYFGNLGKGEGNFFRAVDQLVWAFVSLRERGYDYELVLGGVGTLADDLRDHPVDGVRLLGWVDHSTVIEYLDRARFLVLPSTSNEGLASVSLEAMARHTIVLATPVGGSAELVRDGDTGFMLDDASAAAIMRGIERASEHSDLPGVARRARQVVEERYGFESVVESWNGILRSL